MSQRCADALRTQTDARWSGLPSTSEVEQLLGAAARLAETQGAGSIRQALDTRRRELESQLARDRGVLDRFHEATVRLDRELAASRSAAANSNVTEATLNHSMSRLADAEDSLQKAGPPAADLVRRIQSGVQEIELLCRQAREGRTPPGATRGGQSLAELRERLAREAELGILAKEIDKLASEPATGWPQVGRWLKSAAALPQFQQSVAAARQQLQAGDGNRVRSAVDALGRRRKEILDEAADNQAASERTQAIADAVMTALYEQKYDCPIYGDLKPGDPLSGIRVRADSTSDKRVGNVRVDVLFDGTVQIEVENVPEGEEHICRTVIGKIGEEVTKTGNDFAVVDWGRAKHVAVEQGTSIPTPVVEVQREVER